MAWSARDFPGKHSGGAAPGRCFSTAWDVAADTLAEPLGLAARVFAANQVDLPALTGILNLRYANDTENARVKTNLPYGRAFYTMMSVLSLALFVLNVCTHGTMLGLIGTGGLAVLTGYNAYRAWFGKRHMSRQ